MSFSTSAPVVNPANCPNIDLYNVSSNNGGFKTLLATGLAATVSRQKVVVTVSSSGCSATNRPLILGIQILP